MPRAPAATGLAVCRMGHLLTVIALLVHLALPVAAFAAGAGSGGTRVPVCTGAGIVWMVPGGPSDTPAPQTDGTTVHCPLCWVAGAPALPAPPAAAAVPWQFPVEQASVQDADATIRALAWAPHRSRAPPVSA